MIGIIMGASAAIVAGVAAGPAAGSDNGQYSTRVKLRDVSVTGGADRAYAKLRAAVRQSCAEQNRSQLEIYSRSECRARLTEAALRAIGSPALHAAHARLSSADRPAKLAGTAGIRSQGAGE